MRPGSESVIGEQQAAFLSAVQRIREENAAARRIALLLGPSQCSSALPGRAEPGRAAPAADSEGERRVSSALLAA